MEDILKILNQKFVVVIKHDGKDVFYNRFDGDEFEFVGIRSKAYHFKSEDNANFAKNILSDNGYDAWVEPFYFVSKN